MVDTRLPFGVSPGTLRFHKITQGVKHIFQQRKEACDIVVYLDDFLLIAKTHEERAANLNYLISLVSKLGFALAWDKIGQTHQLPFLG